MKKKLIILILVIVAAGGAGWYFWQRNTPQGIIRRKFADLAYAASKESGEKSSALIYKTQMVLPNLFAETCGLEVKEAILGGDYSREEISSKAAMAHKRFSSAALRFFDLEIEVSEQQPDRAKAYFTVNLDGIRAQGGERVNETREMEATLRKIDGNWVFTNFKIREILRK